MAVYTVKITGTCAGGEHIYLNLLRNGSKVKGMTITKTEILQDETTLEDALIFFMRQAIRKAGATTLAQAKTAVEAAEWEV